MKPADATIDDMMHVFGLYKTNLEPDTESISWRSITPAKVYETLQRALAGDSGAETSMSMGFRLGSKWGDDKLAFNIGSKSLTVKILTNLEKWMPEYEEAMTAHKTFEKDANEYLS